MEYNPEQRARRIESAEAKRFFKGLFYALLITTVFIFLFCILFL